MKTMPLELCKDCGDKAIEYFMRHGTARSDEFVAACPTCAPRKQAVDFQNAALSAAAEANDE